jgi:segregation and condensation protein A
MKSDQLAGIDFLNALEDAEWDDLGEPAPGEDMALMRINPLPIRGMVTSLDEAIKRRTSTKQPRIRPVTLEDLIQELRKYEELEKKRSLREKVEKASQRRVADYSQFTSDDIEDLAHEEFIEDTIFHLKDLLERILVKEEQVSLSQLHQSNLQGRGQMDKISAFIALLFLDLRGDVEIFQQEFYGELFIRKAPPAPLPGSADTPPDAVGDDTMELAG